MEEMAHRDVLLQSIRRCIASEEFMPAFYERFLGASEEIRKKFRSTDLQRQHQMLARSLELCAAATMGEPAALAEIRERATTHDRDHLNIEPHFYDIWLETLIATACEFDREWNDTVEQAWRRILGYVIQRMIRQY